MSMAVTVKNLTFCYPGREKPVLDGISFSVREGESVGIVGLSGCGKSTLGLILCGAIPKRVPGYIKGEVYIFGKPAEQYDLPRIGSTAGIVLQNADWQLFTNRVEDEVAFALENLCIEPEEIRKRVARVLEQTGIRHLADRSPRGLSGGEKHLVALASAMSMEPSIIILDEVMSGLDAKSCRCVGSLMKKWKREGKTIIAIDHQVERLESMERLFLMKEGGMFETGAEEIEAYYGELIKIFLSGGK